MKHIQTPMPAPTRLHKHIVVHGENLSEESPCPIEYRNILIKELDPGLIYVHAEPRACPPEKSEPLNLPHAKLLAGTDDSNLPKRYNHVQHREYVNRCIAGLSDE